MQGLTLKKKKKSCTLVFGFAAFSSLANHCVLPTSSRSTHRYWQDNCLNIWCNSLLLLSSLTNNNTKLYFFICNLIFVEDFCPRSGFKVQSVPLKGVQARTFWGGGQLGRFLCLWLDAFHVFAYRIHFRLGLSSGLGFFALLLLGQDWSWWQKITNVSFCEYFVCVCVCLDLVFFLSFFPCWVNWG